MSQAHVNPVLDEEYMQSIRDETHIQVLSDNLDWEGGRYTLALTDGSDDTIEVELDVPYIEDILGEDLGCSEIKCLSDGEYLITIGYTRDSRPRYNIVHEYETHTRLFTKNNPIINWWSEKRQDVPDEYDIIELVRK